MQVEAGKIALSADESVELQLDRLSPPQTLQLERSDFDASIQHLVTTVELTVGNLLRDAGVRADAIDTVFFTGGSSGVHLLRQKIGALVPNARQVEGDLFGSIGTGLALDAIRKFS